ncbi:hypothetical protein C8R46DRAFT_1219279 [Mycena filopes]|nr:hypothetical protein C8R46DRAFT_1219279 [Mycena filopes]
MSSAFPWVALLGFRSSTAASGTSEGPGPQKRQREDADTENPNKVFLRPAFEGEAKAEIERLAQDNRVFDDALNCAKRDLELQTANLKAALTAITQWEIRYNAASEELNSLSDAANTTDELNSQTSAELEKTRAELEEARADLEEIADAAATADSLALECEELSQKNEDLTHQCLTLEKSLQQARDDLTRISAENTSSLDDKTNETMSLQRELEQHQAAQAQTSEEIRLLEEKHANTLQQVIDGISKTKASALEIQLAKSIEKVDQAQAERQTQVCPDVPPLELPEQINQAQQELTSVLQCAQNDLETSLQREDQLKKTISRLNVALSLQQVSPATQRPRPRPWHKWDAAVLFRDLALTKLGISPHVDGQLCTISPEAAAYQDGPKSQDAQHALSMDEPEAWCEVQRPPLGSKHVLHLLCAHARDFAGVCKRYFTRVGPPNVVAGMKLVGLCWDSSTSSSCFVAIAQTLQTSTSNTTSVIPIARRWPWLFFTLDPIMSMTYA